MTSPSTTVPALPRRSVSQLLLACIVILILAQALIGALSLSALNRLVANNTADRIELSARQSASHIQTGLNLGKQLAQYFGLGEVLQGLKHELPGLLGASVVLPDGHVLASVGQQPDGDAVLAVLNGRTDGGGQRIAMTAADAARQLASGQVRLAIALDEPGSAARGALVVDMALTGTVQDGLLMANVRVLVITTLGAALLLIVLLRYAVPGHMLTARSRLRRWIPVLVLLAAQGLYATHTIHSFRNVWLDVTHDNAAQVVAGVQRDLERVLSYGIRPDRLVGVEAYLARVMRSFPVIRDMQLTDLDGVVLTRADAQGLIDAVPDDDAGATIAVPLQAVSQAGPVAVLAARLDSDQLRAGVWARVLDAATIAVIALVAAFELLLLLDLFLGMSGLRGIRKRTTGTMTLSEEQRRSLPLLARPIMFGFLFAWALVLGFLPLYARSLIPVGTAPEQVQLLMALPIVAEMGWGLLTVLLAGRLSDRYGWQRPVLIGLLISIAANVACAMAPSLATLVAARSLVGIGYGLTWMGLQGFVVIHSPAGSRGSNMASVIAGLFAGHLSGVAVGAMMMEQLGARAVFYSGAVLYGLPLLGVLVVVSLLRPSSRTGATWSGGQGDDSTTAPQECVQKPSRFEDKSHRPSVRDLLFSRDFGMLLLASIVPFSIAQVGLLSFALPLYLEADGFHASSVGRVLMVYGLCVIYLGPPMGRMADRATQKKGWIVMAGLVGSLGLLSFAVLDGAVAAVVAVLCLAMAGCLAGGAQTAYMLALGRVERYGSVGATSVMRAADKVGQMLGPLIVAGLFAVTSMGRGLVLTGLLYLAASLLFMFVAPGSRSRRDNSASPAP